MKTGQVRERLNSYFGYPAVGAVKIVQRAVGGEAAEERPLPAAELPAELAKRLDGVDGPLKESLRALGRAVLARS